MAIRLIRKQARGFRVGEWLFLFGATCPITGRTFRGAYEISEIKRMSDTTLTFMLDGTAASSHEWATVEFLRDQEVHRIAGEPLGFIIHEEELL